MLRPDSSIVRSRRVEDVQYALDDFLLKGFVRTFHLFHGYGMCGCESFYGDRWLRIVPVKGEFQGVVTVLV